MATEYYTNTLYEYLETLDTKIAKKLFNKFDEDILSVYVKDGVFFIEPTNSNFPIPNYVSNWIHKEMVKRGFVPSHKGIIVSQDKQLETAKFNALIDSGEWHLSSNQPVFFSNINATSGRVFFGDKEFEIYGSPNEIKIVEYGPTEYSEKVGEKYFFLCNNVDDLEGLYHIKQGEYTSPNISVIKDEKAVKLIVTDMLLKEGAISSDKSQQYESLKDSKLSYPAQYYKKFDTIPKVDYILPSVSSITQGPNEKFTPEMIDDLKNMCYSWAAHIVDKDLPMEYNVKLLALEMVSKRYSDQRIKMITDNALLFCKYGCSRQEFSAALDKALKDPIIIACRNDSWNRVEDAVKKSKTNQKTK